MTTFCHCDLMRGVLSYLLKREPFGIRLALRKGFFQCSIYRRNYYPSLRDFREHSKPGGHGRNTDLILKFILPQFILKSAETKLLKHCEAIVDHSLFFLAFHNDPPVLNGLLKKLLAFFVSFI